ncbi:hypothetical protein CHS0354_029674 [Potamilus streckersoni]|uniref:Uncharacterized protein n=1 Tax=Potamilus streckersoni TaxID=2493646 RepID=A0AAE0VIC8_9BIVA|nr:hypothetical protein CHS0354_029674 [Potamilus streckersoni]
MSSVYKFRSDSNIIDSKKYRSDKISPTETLNAVRNVLQILNLPDIVSEELSTTTAPVSGSDLREKTTISIKSGIILIEIKKSDHNLNKVRHYTIEIMKTDHYLNKARHYTIEIKKSDHNLNKVRHYTIEIKKSDHNLNKVKHYTYRNKEK